MKTKQVLSIMKVISWIIFIGLCIKAGALIISFFVSLFINSEAAKDLYLGLDLSSLYNFDSWYYISMVSLIISVAILKAYIFYLVIKIFLKFDINNPFSLEAVNLVYKISYIALGTGIISKVANSYKIFLTTHKVGANIPVSFGGDEFLFMAGILFIIAFLFKRGVELQQENDLTI
jgi:hypothetical protein